MGYYGSVSGWESSYFGGYEKVLYDHPDISVPFNLDFETPDGNIKGLSWYLKQKLDELFLLKVSQLKLVDQLLNNSEIKTVNKYGFKYKRLVMDKKSVNYCLDAMIALDTELGNMFQHFQDIILKSTFYYKVNDKDLKGLDFSDPNAMGECMQKAADSFAQIKVKKSLYTRYSSGYSVSGDLKKDTTFITIDKLDRPVKYTATETTQAANLLRMLDISFDPKKDKIPNLKAGKLSVQKIAEIPAGNSHVYHREEENQTTKPFSICILCDESGSMQGDDLTDYQTQLVKVLYKAFSEIIPADKIFIYGHSGDEAPEVRIYNEKYNPIFEYTINQQPHQDYRQNYDGPAIECIYERVRSQTSDNVIFISISDGEPSGRNYGGEPAIKDLKRVIEKCKRDGFVTVGIGLEYGRMKEIYQYHTVVTDPDTLIKNVSGLLNRVVKTEFQD